MDNIYAQPGHSWVYPAAAQYSWVWQGIAQPGVAPIAAGGTAAAATIPQQPVAPPPHRGQTLDTTA